MKTEIRESKRIELELLISGDGRVFLTTWNWMTPGDINAELKNEKLYLTGTNREVTIAEFIELVQKSYSE